MTQSLYFGRQGTERREAGDKLTQRAQTEPCIPIDEEQGWRSWFWFPGRSYSAAAHWWVREAGSTLIGEWVSPLDSVGHDLHSQMMQEPFRPCVFADEAWNTSMVLPKEFRATLIPRFAIGIAEGRECNAAKIEEDMFGAAIWHHLELTEVAAKWMISQLVAELNQPDDFLPRLLRVFPKAEKIGWIAAWLGLYLPYISTPRRQ